MQFDLFELDDEITDKTLDLPSGFRYVPNFVKEKAADDAFEYLFYNLTWQQPRVEVYGKLHLVPRLQCWMGNIGMHYQYSGKLFKAVDWDPYVLDVKTQVEKLVGKEFNSALVNLYRDGNDKMGWHADDEKELGPSPAVVTVSFGAKRSFQVKHNDLAETINIELGHGSLLLMQPGVQASYKHAVPARKKVTQGRISLTFRNILQSD